MTMSASFSLKMMRIRIAVIDTGSISGKVTSQNPLPAGRAVDLGGLLHLLRDRLQAGEEHDHHEGDEGPGVHRHDGRSAPSRASSKKRRVLPAQEARQTGERAEAGLQHRLADHPADRHRATASAAAGRPRERTCAPGSRAFSSSARPKAIAYSTRIARHVPDHVAEARSSRTGRPTSGARLSRPLNLRPVGEAQVPVGEGDDKPEAAAGRSTSDSDEQHRGQHEERALALLAPDQHLAPAQARSPTGHRRKASGASWRSRSCAQPVRIERLQQRRARPAAPAEPQMISAPSGAGGGPRCCRWSTT